MKKATHRHSKHTILLLMFFRPSGLELNQLVYFLNPECVPWVWPQRKFPLKIFGYGAFYQKKSLFRQFPCTHIKNVAGSCALNFDATDLPHS